MYEIAVVEVMVIVVGITKVLSGVACSVCARGNDAFPGTVINQRNFLPVGYETRKSSLQLAQALKGKVGLLAKLMDCVNQGSKFTESFSAKVHAVEVDLSVHVLVYFRVGCLVDDV